MSQLPQKSWKALELNFFGCGCVEIKECLVIDELPEQDKGRYHTVSGLILLLLGKMPVAGDSVVLQDWKLEVVDMDGRRIDKILATRII